MQEKNDNRRKRKRTPTITPRFGGSSIALELGLIRLAISEQKNTISQNTSLIEIKHK